MKVKDKEHAKQVLSDGEIISFHIWRFSESFMSCHEIGCCDSWFESIDEAVDTIEDYCNGNWEECEID